MRITHIKITTAPSLLSGGQTVKPNSVLKTDVLKGYIWFSK